MGREPKFAVLEVDGEELTSPSEYEPVSEDIYYDAGKEKTVKDRIDTFAKGYGVFFKYLLMENLAIPAGRSMIVSEFLEIPQGKFLEVETGGIFEVS